MSHQHAFLVLTFHLSNLWTTAAASNGREHWQLSLNEEIEGTVLSLVQIAARARRHNFTAYAASVEYSGGQEHAVEEEQSTSWPPASLPKVAASLPAALPADVNRTEEASLFASSGGASLGARVWLAGKVAVGDGEDVLVLFSCFGMFVGLTLLLWGFASLEPKGPAELARNFRPGHRPQAPWQWPRQKSGPTANKTPLLALCTKFLTANSDLPLLVPLDLLQEDENGTWLIRILNPKGVARLCAVLRRAASGTRSIEITEAADLREHDPGPFIASISEHLEIRDQHNGYFGRLQRQGHSPEYILDDFAGRPMLAFTPASNGDVVATLPNDREALATAARISSARRGEVALFTPKPGVDVVLVLLCTLAVSVFESPATEAARLPTALGAHADAAAIAARRAEHAALARAGWPQASAQPRTGLEPKGHNPHGSHAGTAAGPRVAFSHIAALGGVRCPAGHDLREGTKLSWWICDGCQINPPFAERFRCATCDFDLCKDCYIARQQLLKPRAGGSWQSLPASTTVNTPRDPPAALT